MSYNVKSALELAAIFIGIPAFAFALFYVAYTFVLWVIG